MFTKEEFVKKANKVHNKYDYSLVEYSGNKNHIDIICPKHGIFSQRPDKHLRGQGCPKCNKSHGETSIERFLIKNNINYLSQYKILIDSNINPSGEAFIDFYLPDYNLFIEYNGEQHYIPKNYFGGKTRLNIQQKRDDFVRKYCKKNNIRLLEIPYTELKIEECLFNNILNND